VASVGTEPNGHQRVLFVAADGSRKTVRLGKCSRRDARQVARHIEALLAARITGQPVTRETAIWLSGIAPVLRDRLARAGLVTPHGKADTPTVDAFCRNYIAERVDLKQSTLTLLQQARVWLVRHVGPNRRLDEVTPADADAYKAAMHKAGLARATIARRLRLARQFFAVALRRELVERNPFAGIRETATPNLARRVFVPAETIYRVIDAAPDAEWRLLIALARFGGLRVPSEPLAMTWSDVDWEGRRFIVRACKTEHHEGGGIRVVPIFTALRPFLEDAFDEAPAGTVHVIARHRYSGLNYRTDLVRIIERSGVKPWPKPWQNLRASRATELADQYPSHVCSAWLGHTERIANANYRMVLDEHFARATIEGCAAQNPAQQGAASARNEPQARRYQDSQDTILQSIAIPCDSLRNEGLGDAGLEPATSSV